MPSRNKIASEIIDRLGGTVAFANWYGVDRRVVSHWRNYGFPAHSFAELSARLKAEKKITADVSAWHMARRSNKKQLKPRKPKPAVKGGATRATA